MNDNREKLVTKWFLSKVERDSPRVSLYKHDRELDDCFPFVTRLAVTKLLPRFYI